MLNIWSVCSCIVSAKSVASAFVAIVVVVMRFKAAVVSACVFKLCFMIISPSILYIYIYIYIYSIRMVEITNMVYHIIME